MVVGSLSFRFLLFVFFPPSPSSLLLVSSSPLSLETDEWKRATATATATYYAANDPLDTLEGACGYGDLGKKGYGLSTVALSGALFGKGEGCGGCYELRCVEDLQWCIPGTSIVVTATNFCPPNYALPLDSGGWCNPPNQHIVMPIAVFEKIAIWKAGNMPVAYRRVKCVRAGGMRFTINGFGFFHSVLITNVAGAGDVVGVKIKGSGTGWLPMARNWGQNWHCNAELKNQGLSFEVTTSDGKTLTCYNVAPRTWAFGQTFEGKQFPL